jgi:hypothetical protein
MRRNRRVLLALGLAITMIAGACGSDGGGGDSASGSGSTPDVHSMLLDGTSRADGDVAVISVAGGVLHRPAPVTPGDEAHC